MSQPDHGEATRILTSLTRGDAAAAGQLLPIVYAELRALAGRYFRDQPDNHTLEPTALVHEVYLRLVDRSASDFNDRAHFMAVAATAMRQILINHAHGRNAQKRGGGRRPLPLDEAGILAIADERLVDLDRAMEALAEVDPRKARVVEMKFFGGLTVEEMARVLDVSRSTIEADWRMARAWLTARLEGEETSS